MTNRALAVAAAVALVAAILLRYSIVPVTRGDYSIAYKLDRWTGAVTILVRDTESAVEVYQRPPAAHK